MTTTIVNPTPVTDALVALLEAELAFQVGDGEAPPNRVMPYVVLSFLRSQPWALGYRRQASHREMTYQISGVGRSRGEASDSCLRALEVIVTRDATGPFMNALTPTDHVVLDRWATLDLGTDMEKLGSHMHAHQFKLIVGVA